LNEGFADIVANAATYIPQILADFPTDYQNDAIAYLQSPQYQTNVVFGYAYDPSKLPVLNLVLSNEGEGTAAGKQMYLNDAVETADRNPNTETHEQYGSMWSSAVSVIVRCQVARQTIILYSLVKWLMLKNREVLEAAGIMATSFSGTDLIYNPKEQPTFVFSRSFKMDGKVMNTYDVDITADPTLRSVVSAFPEQVRVLPNIQYENSNPAQNNQQSPV
jgi:hypothetical protein